MVNKADNDLRMLQRSPARTIELKEKLNPQEKASI